MTTPDNVRPIDDAKTKLTDYFDSPTDGKYEDWEFYTASTDSKKGHHSSHVRIKYPLYAHAAISEFVNSDQWPAYTTVESFIRDAIIHHIVRRKRDVKTPGMQQRLQVLVNEMLFSQHASEILDQERRQRERMSAIDQIEREVTDRGVKRAALMRMQEDAEVLPPHHREQIVERIRDILRYLS